MEKKTTKKKAVKKTTKKEALEKLSKNCTKKPINNDDAVEAAFEDESKQIALEIMILKKIDAQGISDWLIDSFDGMVQAMNYLTKQNFLDNPDTESRFYKIMCMQEFWKHLETFEIDDLITHDVMKILVDKQESDLVDFLQFLNFA
jgi:hypothetical protein